ncbi:MAG: hypothetical protein R3F61_38010 [Myxococcota bacterium]
MNVVAKLDASLAVTRPLWHWLGQVALVVVGTHLAADRLDDDLARLLAALPLAWPDPQIPFDVGGVVALTLELAVAVWAVIALARTAEQPVKTPKEWAQRWSIHNLIGPLFWLPVSLAGSWAIAMAIEDALPHGTVAQVVGGLVGALVAWRLAATGLIALVRSPPVPRHRTDGLLWMVPLLVIGGYAAWYGLPVWGWL